MGGSPVVLKFRSFKRFSLILYFLFYGLLSLMCKTITRDTKNYLTCVGVFV